LKTFSFPFKPTVIVQTTSSAIPGFAVAMRMIAIIHCFLFFSFSLSNRSMAMIFHLIIHSLLYIFRKKVQSFKTFSL